MWEEKWVSRVHTQHHAASANYKCTFVRTDTDSTLLYRPKKSKIMLCFLDQIIQLLKSSQRRAQVDGFLHVQVTVSAFNLPGATLI